ncbi:Ribonuclease H2 subunit A [Portunus trituberculatus]|uniref:Ribonuclease n=1 Tax=Portunus trituberculatus TaxID=210409 RepID=A0A5B7E6E6_PORTR|nr:Ribonuclease H2 subunit A [Portunus trituberculatus]
MVYGICFCPVTRHEDLKSTGVEDSKTLKEEDREKIFDIIHNNNDFIGWSLEIISPVYISSNMYKRPKVSLNEISHNSAIGLIKRAISAGVQVSEVYVDTVGPPEKYEAKLQEIFPTIKVTVAKKADALYPCVSGASICAKVARDKALVEWEFPEGTEARNWGSGYPGDPVTKNFLQNSLDPVFGFPGLELNVHRANLNLLNKLFNHARETLTCGGGEGHCATQVAHRLIYFCVQTRVSGVGDPKRCGRRGVRVDPL